MILQMNALFLFIATKLTSYIEEYNTTMDIRDAIMLLIMLILVSVCGFGIGYIIGEIKGIKTGIDYTMDKIEEDFGAAASKRNNLDKDL